MRRGWRPRDFRAGSREYARGRPGRPLGKLRADIDDLKDGRDQHGQERDVLDVGAERHRARKDAPGAEIHDERADDAQEHGGGKAHHRGGGEGLQNIFEQALHTAGENALFKHLGMVTLDDANAGQRFGEAAGDFRVEPGTRAVDGPNHADGAVEGDAEADENREGDAGHKGADAQENDQGETAGHDAAHELDQARADQIAQAFDVAHDARDQGAGFIGVVKGDGKAADVSLHLAAEVGNHALRGLGQQLRERVGGDALNRGRGQNGERQGGEQIYLALADDVVDQEFRGCRQRESGDAIDGHEAKAQE